jgi:hypothetical protein
MLTGSAALRLPFLRFYRDIIARRFGVGARHFALLRLRKGYY